MKDFHPHRSAIRNCSACLLAGHHVLDQSGDDGEDRASGAAADDLTHDGPEVEVAARRRACDRRNEGLQNLTSTHAADGAGYGVRSEEHTSELQSLRHLVCRLLLEKKKMIAPWLTRHYV